MKAKILCFIVLLTVICFVFNGSSRPNHPPKPMVIDLTGSEADTTKSGVYFYRDQNGNIRKIVTNNP